LVARNHTFLSVHVFGGRNLKPLEAPSLNESLALQFHLSSLEMEIVSQPDAVYYCASREAMGDRWKKNSVELVEFDQEAQTITCEAFHLSQFALFIPLELEIIQNSTNNTGNESGGLDPLNPNASQVQNNSGQWVNETKNNSNETNSSTDNNTTVVVISLGQENALVLENQAT